MFLGWYRRSATTITGARDERCDVASLQCIAMKDPRAVGQGMLGGQLASFDSQSQGASADADEARREFASAGHSFTVLSE